MSKPVIYICEDDAALGSNIESLLQSQGYDAHWFYDGTSLGEAISKKLPDLLLLDVQLPGEDGMSLAQRYMSSIPGLRIIMMSVRDSDAMRHQGYASGAMMYMPKPFEPAALLACLQGLYGSRVSIPGLQLSLVGKAIQDGKLHVALTNAEVVILRELSLAAGDIVEYYYLLECLGIDLDATGKSKLEVLISRLRRKLKTQLLDTELQVKNRQKQGYYLQGSLTLVEQ